LHLSLKGGLIFNKVFVTSINDSVIYVALDKQISLFFCVSLEEGRGLNNFVLVFNLVFFKVKVLVNLEQLCLKLVAVTIKGVRLISANVSSFRGLGISRGVYCDVTYLKGV
jgi:hypothetical protein